MLKKEYLNEEEYEKTKNKITMIALIILMLGIAAGSLLIYIGVSRSSGIDKAAIQAQKTQEFFANGHSQKYYELEEQLDKAYSSIVFYAFGGFVILASCMWSASTFMFTKQREILAFTTQQGMPIAQEGMEKMAPTVGNVAKEITKGIKEGLKEEDK